MNAARIARNVSAGAVAAIAAWSSYSHMVSVALAFGERPEVAYLLPVSVDGLLVVASVAMVDDRRNGGKPRWSARLAFAVGVLASIAANIAAAEPTPGARIVAGWPALALLLVVEMLAAGGRAHRTADTTPAATAQKRTDSSKPTDSSAGTPPIVAAKPPATKKAVPKQRQRPRRPVAETLALVEAIRAKNPTATRDDLAEELGLSRRRVDTILAAATK